MAFERITRDELQNTLISEPYFVGSILNKSRRVTEHAQIYWVEVLGRPTIGEFYPINDLPERLIESQRKFIAQAAASFKRYKT